jgi:hypothetical protein
MEAKASCRALKGQLSLSSSRKWPWISFDDVMILSKTG